jgi:tRNA uridine 5-carboxymethylaminomethyl modification enzyme
LSGALVRPDSVSPALLEKLEQPLQREVRAFELLRRPELDYDDVSAAAAADAPLDGDWLEDERLAEQVKRQVDVQAKYSGYLKRQTQEIDRQQRHEGMRLPVDLDYSRVSGLSNEARQSLDAVRPETLGQAARIPGLTPAALSLLLVYLKKHDRAA